MNSEKIKRQLDTKIMEDDQGNYAVCVDKESDWKDWLLQKHPDGNWVTLRQALPQEVAAANAQYYLLSSIIY